MKQNFSLAALDARDKANPIAGFRAGGWSAQAVTREHAVEKAGVLFDESPRACWPMLRPCFGTTAHPVSEDGEQLSSRQRPVAAVAGHTRNCDPPGEIACGPGLRHRADRVRDVGLQPGDRDCRRAAAIFARRRA
jgi:hypothetical protein